MKPSAWQVISIVLGVLLASTGMAIGAGQWTSGSWGGAAVVGLVGALVGVALAIVGMRPAVQRSGTTPVRSVGDDVETSWNVRANARSFTDLQVVLLLCLVASFFFDKSAAVWLAGPVLFSVLIPIIRRSTIASRER